MLVLMKNGLNLHDRPKVNFQLTPPVDSAEKTSGHQRKPESTAHTKKTSTNQVSSRAKHLAELLKDLTGNNFPQLASVLLPKLESRGRTAPKRRKYSIIKNRRRKREYYTSSGEDSSESSRSFSSGAEDTDSSSVGDYGPVPNTPIGSDEETNCSAIQTRLAPLPGQKDFRGLGPKI